jgi:hypothetical protein
MASLRGPPYFAMTPAKHGRFRLRPGSLEPRSSNPGVGSKAIPRSGMCAPQGAPDNVAERI